ncbi:MAG: S8 family serine peptidase [Chitinophagales bacterium]|nr:S8 family serine peptidase [Chitinophagales bacterium]
MRKLKPLLFTVLFFLITNRAFPQTIDSLFVDGALYAKLYDTSSAHLDLVSPPLNALVQTYGLDTLYWPFRLLNSVPLHQTYRLQFSDISNVDSLIQELEALPMIEYAEKVPLVTNNFEPNDLHPNQAQYLSRILAEQAWNITKGSTQIVVAVIDNGVRLTHEDLAANIWINPGEIPGNGIDDEGNGFIDDINGFDVADNDNNPNPPLGIAGNSDFNHGTHCAGIVSATTDNGKGIASIGFNLKIMPVKTVSNTGNGRSLTHAFEGVSYAMRSGADVISMSFGGEFSQSQIRTITNLMNAGFNAGIVLVAAAGNENVNVPFVPASIPNVISVGATNSNNDQKASFSNFGTTVDVMAPGVNIFSTLGNANNSYGFLSGTSMACPLVAGLAGLILSVNPGFTPTQVNDALINGCDNIIAQNPGFNGQIGAGRVNAQKTLSQITTIRESKTETPIVLYPNPVEEILHIRLETNEAVEVQVFNTLGQVVYEDKFFGNYFTIPLTEIEDGMHTISVQTTSGAWRKKILKI